MGNLLTQPIVFPLTGTIAKLLTGTMVNVIDFCNLKGAVFLSGEKMYNTRIINKEKQ